ncbi:MAG: c-type cytochrome [Alphaproteobacteria bacterium]
MTADGPAAALAALMALVNAGLALPASAGLGEGQALYAGHCLTCHQANGGGVPMMQPALIGSAIVTGPPELLIRWTLQGTPDPAAPGLWANTMPGFSQLSDGEIAAILTYVRQGLSHPDVEAPLSSVTPAQVARERAAF